LIVDNNYIFDYHSKLKQVAQALASISIVMTPISSQPSSIDTQRTVVIQQQQPVFSPSFVQPYPQQIVLTISSPIIEAPVNLDFVFVDIYSFVFLREYFVH
jgi:hypothetical protein